MNHFIEIMLALFWTGYLLLHWVLMRAPVNEVSETQVFNDPLPGEQSCTTPAMK